MITTPPIKIKEKKKTEQLNFKYKVRKQCIGARISICEGKMHTVSIEVSIEDAVLRARRNEEFSPYV